MADKVRFVLDKEAFRENVLLSEGLGAALKEKAEQVRARCGDGYKAYQNKGRQRQLALVIALSDEAQKDNSDNNTLLKALY